MADQLPQRSTAFEDDEVTHGVVANPFGAASSALSHAGQQQGSSGQAAVVAEAQALQMHIMLARANPRDQKQAYDDIMAAFNRPTLAEKAEYEYAKGGTEIKGPSIRAAEAIAQQWGNIYWGFSELTRMNGYSEVYCFAHDLQKGTLVSRKFWLRHWIDTKGGGRPTRDEREINELMSNQAQRRVRQCILGVIPGDVTEDAIKQAQKALVTKVELTPEKIQKVIDAFAKRGVTKEQIEKRVQRHMDSIGPAQYLYLLRIFNSLRDGMSIPSEWFEPEDVVEGEQPTPGNALERAKDALAKKAQQQQKQAEQPPADVTEEEKKAEAVKEPTPPAEKLAEQSGGPHPKVAADLKRIASSRTTVSLDALKKALISEWKNDLPVELDSALTLKREELDNKM